MIQHTDNPNSSSSLTSHALPSESNLTNRSNADVINLLDYIEVIAKHWRIITKLMAAAFVISIIYSIMIAKTYRSSTLILPPQQDQGLMGMMIGQMGGVASLAGDLLGKGNSTDMYVSILGSNTLSDVIIDKFKLMEIYGEKYRLDTYKTLDKKVDIAAGKKDGIITITVEDRDPKRAADMANAYVDELAKLTLKLNITGAGQNRAFYEERLVKAKSDLANAGNGLKKFQSKNKALDIMDQAKATIEGIAQLRAQLAMHEVQFETLRRQFTDTSQEVKNYRAIISNIKSQIARLEGDNVGGAIPSVGSVPALGQEYVRLMREFKIQEAIVELLTKQYEIAKLTESKDVSGIQIIQQARVPDKKYKPKRSIIVFGSTFGVGFFAILYVLILKAFQEMTQEDKEQWNRIRSMFPTISRMRHH